MRLHDLLGHDTSVAFLRQALAADRLPHALLFHGPEGVGKARVARALAMALLCETVDAEGCARCAACLRVARGTHPDFLVVTRLPRSERRGEPEGIGADGEGDEAEAEGADLRKDIIVAQIRELSEHAAFAPREGRRRLFVVDPADRMNPAAQNAFLKTLEEPAGRAVFVLVTSRPHLLLPTIRSRCTPVGFTPLPVRQLAEELARRGMPGEEALARAAFASGRPGRALALDLPSLLERREAALGTLETLAASARAASELPELASRLAGESEEELHDGLDMVVSLLRDAARTSLGTGALLHVDCTERLAALGRRLGAERAYEIVGRAERLRGDLRFNVNRTLLAEALLAAVAGGPLP